MKLNTCGNCKIDNHAGCRLKACPCCHGDADAEKKLAPARDFAWFNSIDVQHLGCECDVRGCDNCHPDCREPVLRGCGCANPLNPKAPE